MDKTKQEASKIGKKINKWTIIEKSTEGKWLGRCECGEVRRKAYSEFKVYRQCNLCLKKIFDDLKPGDKVGKWKIKSVGFKKDTKLGYFYTCECLCGNEAQVRRGDLRLRKSTGCFSCRENLGYKTHGLSKTPTWYIWIGIRNRCERQNSSSYSFYGGRGISVCARWKKYKNFLDDMGERPEGKSLDRINNDGNYEPSNCRWATSSEQAYNRRKPQEIYKGKCKICGGDYETISPLRKYCSKRCRNRRD